MSTEHFNIHRPIQRIRVSDWMRVDYVLHGPYCGGCSRERAGRMVNVPWPCYRAEKASQR